jgi:imidazolonepropionase-like amidohydrolase
MSYRNSHAISRSGLARRPFLALALAGMAALASGCQIHGSLPRPVDLAITDVTVIDPESRRVLPGRNVFVDGDRIVAIEPGRGRGGYAARRTIDSSKRFLIPGLLDMHVHLFLPADPTPSLNMLLANGVTSIREMSSDCWALAGAKTGCVEDYRALAAAIREGRRVGPDIRALSSTMVMGPSRLTLPDGAPKFIAPVTGSEGRQLVRYLAGRGVDLIKTHDSIPEPAFAAMMQEANRLGVAVGGHVPFGAGSLGAARAGYRSIEHARDLLYDCSNYGPAYRAQEAAFARGAPGARRPAAIERLRLTVDQFDAPRCGKLLDQLAATKVFYVPTHVTREMETRAADPGYRSDPARRFIPREQNKRWEADLVETAAKPAAERQALRRFFEHGLRITGLAHRAGIPVMAGTDANDTMIAPGFSLHRELLLLRTAGLSNLDVLRSATTVPAYYLGRSAELGGISVGKKADLVLLRANPLSDIRNTVTIEAVVARGRLFQRTDLDLLLARITQQESSDVSDAH